ncbi:double homeobox protein 4C-like [Capricornis sumatraensis]|uniref:double homeobox protein 4C-like n=1 Tax=Capricornis sumatraensis TaxID=34865 RepID=UPI003604A88E
MRRNTVVVFGSPRRRLVLKLSQKDTLQALFQEKPYPGIATRERLAQELGIAQSRVQVWFQNQRTRQLKQSRSPSEYVHQEGEAGPTSTPTPLTPSPRPQSSPPGSMCKPSQEIASRGLPPGKNWLVRRESQNLESRYGFKTEELNTTSRAQQGPGSAAATTTSAPEDRRAPPTAQSTSPPFRPYPPQESMPPSAAAAAPFGAPTFCVSGTASGVCVGQLLMIFMVQPSPVALPPYEKPPPLHQVAVPWAAGFPAILASRQPGQGAILPPGQPEAHIPRWPESSYGKGTAPPLEPQTQPRSLPSPTSLLDELMADMSVLSLPGPFPRAAADQGVDPALPGAPSLLDKLLGATSIPESLGPSPGASAVAGQQPAFAGAPSLLEEILAATRIRATPGPSLGPCADKWAHLALQGSPRLQDEFLASLGIPGSLGAVLGSSSVIAGAQPAFPGSPSFLEEILAATATWDTPWSPPGAPAGDEGVEAILEACLSHEDYRALLDILSGSPGPRA